jgi:hypothetical protein
MIVTGPSGCDRLDSLAGTITRVTKDRIDFGGYKDSALTAVHIYGNPDAGSTETKTEYF